MISKFIEEWEEEKLYVFNRLTSFIFFPITKLFRSFT